MLLYILVREETKFKRIKSGLGRDVNVLQELRHAHFVALSSIENNMINVIVSLSLEKNTL